MLVYDWASGELFGTDRRRRDAPASAFQRFRSQPVAAIAAALDTIDGTTAPAAFRGPEPLHQVAVRACQPAPEQRYGSVADFCAAWRDAWRDAS